MSTVIGRKRVMNVSMLISKFRYCTIPICHQQGKVGEGYTKFFVIFLQLPVSLPLFQTITLKRKGNPNIWI